MGDVPRGHWQERSRGPCHMRTAVKTIDQFEPIPFPLSPPQHAIGPNRSGAQLGDGSGAGERLASLHSTEQRKIGQHQGQSDRGDTAT